MIGRIFSGEFSPRFPRPPRWFGDGESYLVMEPSAGGVDVVRYDTATGARREVLITAAQLTPAGAQAPLEIESLSWSSDRQRVLIFTNAHRVWRTNSRGDYWLLGSADGPAAEDGRRRRRKRRLMYAAVQSGRDEGRLRAAATTSTSRTSPPARSPG